MRSSEIYDLVETIDEGKKSVGEAFNAVAIKEDADAARKSLETAFEKLTGVAGRIDRMLRIDSNVTYFPQLGN